MTLKAAEKSRGRAKPTTGSAGTKAWYRQVVKKPAEKAVATDAERGTAFARSSSSRGEHLT